MRLLLLRSALACSLVLPLTALGQGSELYGPGIKLKPKADGDAYIRFIFWNQLWTRYYENNPGTLINGEKADNNFDIGIRRARFLALAQISPRYLVLFHAGINNQTFATGGVPNGGVTGNGGTYTSGKKPGIFIHDAWNEYAVVPAGKREDGSAKPFSLYAGFGLHYWNGISRMSSASTLNFLTIDAPIFNWPHIEQADQFARQFGFYLKGKAGKLDYRLHVNKPYATTAVPTPTPSTGKVVAVDNSGNPQAAFGGYLMYQFLEQESNVLPFTVGSYVGTKKVFNIGAGFYNQAAGTRSSIIQDGDTTLRKHDINLLGIDVFADLPFGGDKNMAVTAYSVYYIQDWGPNYQRTVGIMNTGTVDTSVPIADRNPIGAGNARVLEGTGNIWYTQAGLLLPKSISTKMRLQPFVAYTMKDIDFYRTTMGFVDAGFNVLLDGHHAKLTFQYSSRPDVRLEATDYKVKGNLGEFLLQAQVYL
ncbi:MAG TPA: porin [Flavobacteriales bacterium]